MPLDTTISGGQAGHLADHQVLHKRHNHAEDVVADYGAVGDNSTDDTTAIQNALNAAITNKTGEVFFAPGRTYKITSTLTWPTGVKITGRGQGKASNVRAKPALQWAGGAGGTILSVENVGDNAYQTPVQGMEFRGDGVNEAATAINFPTEIDSGTYIHDCSFQYFSGDCVIMAGGVTNGYVGGGTRFDHIGGYALVVDLAVNTHLMLVDVEYDCGAATAAAPGGFLKVVGAGYPANGGMISCFRIRTEVNKQLGGNKALIEYVNDGAYPNGAQLKLNAVGFNVTNPSGTDDYAFFRPTFLDDNEFAINLLGCITGNFNAEVLRNVSRVPPNNDQHNWPIFSYATFDWGVPGGANSQSVIEGRMNIRDLEIGGVNAIKDNNNNGVGVLRMANALTVPTGTPTTAGVLYVEGGALKYRSPGGTVTTLGAN